MTQDDLQTRVHSWASKDANEARSLVAALNAEGVDGDGAIAVNLDGTWCIMLASAAERLAGLGVGPIETIP
jgi:hypothetical protein